MINQAGLNLIKQFEGLRLKAYRDAVGVWTIGYGHTSMAGDPKVKAGMVITEDEAEQILRIDLKKYEDAVKKALPGYPLTDNQYAALTSLCYNVGPGNFSKSSVVRYLRQGNPGRVIRPPSLSTMQRPLSRPALLLVLTWLTETKKLKIKLKIGNF